MENKNRKYKVGDHSNYENRASEYERTADLVFFICVIAAAGASIFHCISKISV